MFFKLFPKNLLESIVKIQFVLSQIAKKIIVLFINIKPPYEHIFLVHNPQKLSF